MKLIDSQTDDTPRTSHWYDVFRRGVGLVANTASAVPTVRTIFSRLLRQILLRGLIDLAASFQSQSIPTNIMPVIKVLALSPSKSSAAK
jgi:hypothetical protein